MDTELLKTFLEVEKSRHFGKAALNLYLTPSAVSARIRLLEDMLGVSLFARVRNNLQLTTQGQRLIPHAQAILQSWSEVRKEVAVHLDVPHPSLRIGSVFSLWDMVLHKWIGALSQSIPGIIIQTEIETPEILIRKLTEGVLDVGFFLEPPVTFNLMRKEIMEIPIMLVSSKENQEPLQALHNGYILVDWGSDFCAWHHEKFIDPPSSFGKINFGRGALELILSQGGAAYIAEPLCRHALANKQLFDVRGSPIFESKLYASYASYNPCLGLLEQGLALF